jgi:hypothetical protein
MTCLADLSQQTGAALFSLVPLVLFVVDRSSGPDQTTPIALAYLINNFVYQTSSKKPQPVNGFCAAPHNKISAVSRRTRRAQPAQRIAAPRRISLLKCSHPAGHSGGGDADHE